MNKKLEQAKEFAGGDSTADPALARLCLIQRMKALQERPLPTLKKVQEQWAASIEFNRKLDICTVENVLTVPDLP